MASDGVMRVGANLPHSAYLGKAKQFLKENGALELHGLGSAIENVVRCSEMLISLQYATLVKFDTLTVKEQDRGGVERGRHKVIVKLAKAPGFDAAYEDFEKKRAARRTEPVTKSE
jgi:hypothetical protein